uniref:DUF834 domain-containing protein n=1 Tax=Setaria viridis TaxID=4556 RepID=A0A4U6TDF9_SETVI|nr:hypothetical protein SEVIR_8G049501v2 [Setaria viridis]
MPARRLRTGGGRRRVVQGGDGQVRDLDEHRLPLTILGLGGVDGEEHRLEAGERGWELGREPAEVERRQQGQERERGEAEVGVPGEERVVEPVAGGVVGAPAGPERAGERRVGCRGAEERARGAEESARMRDRACETDSHQDGLGSEAEAEGDGEAAPAPAEDGEGGIAATAAEEPR